MFARFEIRTAPSSRLGLALRPASKEELPSLCHLVRKVPTTTRSHPRKGWQHHWVGRDCTGSSAVRRGTCVRNKLQYRSIHTQIPQTCMRSYDFPAPALALACVARSVTRYNTLKAVFRRYNRRGLKWRPHHNSSSSLSLYCNDPCTCHTRNAHVPSCLGRPKMAKASPHNS